jgi:hypothetical protein
MRPLLLTMLMFFSFHTTSVVAGVCRVIEYAELKDTSSENVVKTFCRYKTLFELEIDHLKRLRDLGTSAKDLAEHTRYIEECTDMLSKIRSALRNRLESDEPGCGP